MNPPRLTIVGLALVNTVAACGDATGPEEELTRVLESEHYVYRYSPGDQVDTLWQETYHRWLLAELQVQLPQKIEFYKYRDRAQMKRLTGEDTNGFAEPGTYRFHSISPIDHHEVVHTVAGNAFGLAPALIDEGFAVAHQTVPLLDIYEPHWGPTPVHDLARDYLETGQMPSLGQLLDSRSFRRLDTEITYPVAGSFVRYLIENGGLPDLKELLRRSTHDDPPTVLRENYQAVFAETIEVVWARWQAYLGSRA